jgi:hypothetical protein
MLQIFFLVRWLALVSQDASLFNDDLEIIIY